MFVRYPDSKTSQRWLFAGYDIEQFTPIAQDENRHLNLVGSDSGPGVPAWTGIKDYDHLCAQPMWNPGPLNTVDDLKPTCITWFEDGRWRVSGSKIDLESDIDPENLMEEDGLFGVFKNFGENEEYISTLEYYLGISSMSNQGRKEEQTENDISLLLVRPTEAELAAMTEDEYRNWLKTAKSLVYEIQMFC